MFQPWQELREEQTPHRTAPGPGAEPRTSWLWGDIAKDTTVSPLHLISIHHDQVLIYLLRRHSVHNSNLHAGPRAFIVSILHVLGLYDAPSFSVPLVLLVFGWVNYSVSFSSLTTNYTASPSLPLPLPFLSSSPPGLCLQVSSGVWLTHCVNNSLSPNEIPLALMKPLMRLNGIRLLANTHPDNFSHTRS